MGPRVASAAKRPTGVLVPVLIQDPSVVTSTMTLGSIIHPVVVKDPGGFAAGPVCRRVAVVDFDFQSGKLGAPVPLDPKGSPYRNIGAYRVDTPSRRNVRVLPWARSREKRDVATLGSIEPDDRFLKVSVFGTVVRTLGMIQDPAVLGREIRWAFPGQQLLVVPRAGELDNAFYHRDSRSLQFYYSTIEKGRAVFSGLSQDIVAHEATHAIIDGIAPSLHDAISAESLAIHEGLADIAAAMLSVRNRELVRDPGGKDVVTEMVSSSRFSRIAEEFGHWRGHGDALRDVCNTRSLDPRGRKDSRVDGSSPHSLSEVLSGLLFEVFCAVFTAAPGDPALWKRLQKGDSARAETLRLRSSFAGNRVLSLAFRGLDWLPPGEASFGDLVAAMLAADRLFQPRQELARDVLVEAAARRHIAVGKEKTIRLGRTVALEELKRSARARAELADSLRERLGIPAGAHVSVTARTFPLYVPPLPTPGETFPLTPAIKPQWMVPDGEHLLVKFSWHETEPNEVASWGRLRRYRTGATLVLDRRGRVRAMLRNAASALQSERRGAFLSRLFADDAAPLETRIGPDGRPLEQGLRASLRGGTLSVSGAMQALHVAGDPP
jgi:hypothetical protein